MKRLFRKAKLLVTFLVVIILLAVFPASALAENPTVTMTVTAGIISISNTQGSWALGYAIISKVIYFSATGAQDDDYSTIVNTGTLPVDIEIQGVNFEGGIYDWILGPSSGNQTYSLYANSSNGSATYNIEVQNAGYNDLIANLASGADYNWSMKFTAPNEFHINEDMAPKNATVTLAVSEHT